MGYCPPRPRTEVPPSRRRCCEWATERRRRLTFEFNVDTYDRELCATLGRHIAGVIARSRPITLDEVDGRSLPVRLRDGIARLFSPYL